MPECTYLTSATSPAGWLPLSVTDLLCINSSGSVLHYQYPKADNVISSPPLASPTTSSVWGEFRDDMQLPISEAPPYVEAGGVSDAFWNSTIISLFWNETCGYN